MPLTFFFESSRRGSSQQEGRVEEAKVFGYLNAVKPMFARQPYIEKDVDANDVNERLAIRVYTNPTILAEKLEKYVFKTTSVFTFGDELVANAKLTVPSALPNWGYYVHTPPPQTPSTEDVLKFFSEFLQGATPATTLGDYTKLTKPEHLKEPFKVSDELLKIVSLVNIVASVWFWNADGGVDIIARVRSMNKREKNKEYAVILSVRRNYGGSNGFGITTFCSCPLGEKEAVVCKHVMTVLSGAVKVILPALDFLYTKQNSSKPVPLSLHGEYVRYWENKVGKLVSELRAKPVEFTAGFVYYLTKFMLANNLISKATGIPEEKKKELEDEVFKSIREEDGKFRKTVDLFDRVEVVEVLTPAGDTLKKIVWSDWADKLRDQVRGLLDYLTEAFGSIPRGANEEQGERRWGEWPLMLAYATIMSSDRTKPPVVLHVVGEIGTFKTFGAKQLENVIDIPVLEFTYRGAYVLEKYMNFISLLSGEFGVPESKLARNVGGIIARLASYPNALTVSLSAPYLYSLALRKYGSVDKVEDFVKKAVNLGFQVQVKHEPPKVHTVDMLELPNIESQRQKYTVDQRLGGIISVSEVFDNHILVVDEGSRNPAALELLLTKMSTTSILENLRIIVVTDNIEPFQRMASDPRYDALRDRTILAMSSALISSSVVEQSRGKQPSVKFDWVKLLALQKFIESIPVPEGIRFLASAVKFALSSKFALLPVETKSGDKMKVIVPASRDERYPVDYDLFGDLKVKFKFVAGGRFEEHTLNIAKFFAFLNGRDYVTLEDFKNALMYTVKSRLVIEDADTYTEYKMKVWEIVSRAMWIVDSMSESLERMAYIAKLMKRGDKDELSETLEEVIASVSSKRELAPALLAVVEAVITNHQVDKNALPDIAKLTVASLMLAKGDLEGCKRYSEEVEVLTRAHKMIISPESTG